MGELLNFSWVSFQIGSLNYPPKKGHKEMALPPTEQTSGTSTSLTRQGGGLLFGAMAYVV